MGPIHTQDHRPGCSGADQNLSLGKQEVELILCPFRNITGGREPALPSNHMEAHR